MTFYFSSDGSLKYTTNKVASKGILSSSSSSSSSSSKFSTEMKNAALTKAGKLNSDDKKALLASNGNYQIFAKYQAKINEIAARKPRTFDDSSYTTNLSALKNYNAALAKQAKTTKNT